MKTRIFVLILILILNVLFIAGSCTTTTPTLKSGQFRYVRNGDITKVQSLIDAGANVNEKTRRGITALMIASEEGNTEVTKLLIEKGADVNAQDYYGETALMKAAKHGRIEIVKILIEAGADVNAITRSVAWSRSTLSGGIAEGETLGGYTALMAASEKGYKDIVKLLIVASANINAQTHKGGIFAIDEGATALMFASRGGYPEVVKLLIDEGANINVQDYDGRTAKEWALRGEDVVIAMEIVNLLIEAGAKE